MRKRKPKSRIKKTGTKKHDGEISKRLNRLEKLLKDIAHSLSRSHFYEYVQYVSDEKRMIKRAFLLGVLKGVGTAIGFSLLGALAIYILHIIAESNLPYIADFISDIIDIINGTGK